ncbi:MAG: hypothetical protein UR84_C0017G0011 [candidate division WS6 bacterium GW2011_GWD1_35_594]|nr:MAG: hypothetical protein UR84_C0017G0011 [candidate division WS6 bacterium GW2011_GWD1_35_594]
MVASNATIITIRTTTTTPPPFSFFSSPLSSVFTTSSSTLGTAISGVVEYAANGCDRE